ncbi:Protein O-linked-mannose beta-1,2-N-acetylglucosaminyltransferase 1 [Holothuria leucospilota]|uniref:Protein O-linked-mannose beta-1,2-N-acetylglucosaminyltransferase 1 n=1 Tax=Holothuria leucospilota TaxID=206669 RepID=A0A9Q1HIP8_HOLLE|nr:Protein O-linked-mannose beta-1,2-N-acetylglucosaminyltransferase 1 [Holothuria leucospilota]
MNYRSSWVFAGQKGREHGVPYEAITQSSKDNAWADVASVKGCLSFPEFDFRAGKKRIQAVRRSEGPVCGMQSACSENHTAVNVLSSSLENTALLPVSFCVNGRRNFINTGSRGLNFLVYDLHWRSVMMSQTFDTHESEAESERLVKFLESVGDNQLLIGAVYDDASRWLTVNAKDTLERFGALKIHDLTFRGMWVFVGRRGVEGASPYEELNKATNAKDKKDAKAELSACIPDRIDGFQRLHPAERRRKEFCSKYPSYTDLCSEEGKRVLKQIPLDDLSLSKNQAYNTPILVIGGADLQSLQRCMDSLLAIPGLNRDNVYVVLEGHFQEPSDLVTLYGFRVKEQPSQKNYHGYAHSSGDPQLFYRTQAFPGFGWVLSRSIWPEMKEFKFSCCDVPTWKGWFQGGLMRGRETVVPDLSRVKRHLPPGFTMETPFMRGYLKDRVSSNDSSIEPRETYKLTYEQYEKEIKFLIGRSRLFDTSILKSCLEEGTRLTTGLSFDKSAIYAVYFQQISPTDVSVLVKLASCFGLFISDEIPFRSWHDSVVRFTSHKSQFILIGSKSKHFGMKPDSAEVVG